MTSRGSMDFWGIWWQSSTQSHLLHTLSIPRRLRRGRWISGDTRGLAVEESVLRSAHSSFRRWSLDHQCVLVYCTERQGPYVMHHGRPVRRYFVAVLAHSWTFDIKKFITLEISYELWRSVQYFEFVKVAELLDIPVWGSSGLCSSCHPW
jgi:hypothetical protein